ncbi:MAG: modC [Actinomycetia bacterium]|nr:modC [Actinomycetes bacterium]
MTLRVRVDLRLGSLHLDVDLDVEPGETVAILGPNGAGKTTLLRCIGGLAPIDAGRLALDDDVWDEPGAGIFVPPERRSVGFGFQDYVLFPHLSARENVAFGPRSRGVAKREARHRAEEWLGRVGLGDVAGAKPEALSGGQAQRVALARALATDPQVLLLDEPLAALDASTRGEVRRDLRAHLAAFPGVRILVTHDPIDAATLADRLVIVEDGRIVQTGTLAEVTGRPRSRYVAELVGVNLVQGVASGNDVALDGGGVLVVPSEERGAVFAVIRPQAVALHRTRPAGSPRNVWSGRVASVELLGDRVRVRVDGSPALVAEVTPAALHELALVEGAEIWVSLKATEVNVFAG